MLGKGLPSGVFLALVALVVAIALGVLYSRDYVPSVIEATILTGTLALFVLLYLLAIKFVPVISVWEENRGRFYAGSLASPG